jgi:hypothetical protein
MQRRSLVTTTSGKHSDANWLVVPPNQQYALIGVAAVLLGCATSGIATPIRWFKRSISISPARTFCDERDAKDTDTDSDTDSPESPGPHNDFGATIIENDPYDNLPEEDEETECVLCNTFRQGPCRKYWRKTERCWKENDADKCIAYSTPFMRCSMYYQNVYLLIMLNNYQNHITELEKDSKSVAIRQFSDDINAHAQPFVMVDWQPWIEFCKDFGTTFCQTVPLPPSSDTIIEKRPLWERVPPNTEPVIVPCNVTLPKHYFPFDDKTKLMELTMAYATDQDGFVIGKYFKSSKSSDEEESASDEETDTNNGQMASTSSDAVETDTTITNDKNSNKSNNNDVNNTAEISCIILPGEIRSISVTAYYTVHNLTESDNKNDTEIDAIVYKRDYDLFKIINEKN